MRGILLSSLLLLSACAMKPVEPGIKTVYVDRPVVTVEKCLKKEDKPTKPSGLGSLPNDESNALRLSLAKLAEWVGYGNRTDIVFNKCTGE